MANKNLVPPVGYMGGKRRLLPRIRPYLDPERIRLYVEPFVGMGAVYLDLRARGYKGPAILADANPEVANFWRFVHSSSSGQALLDACRALLAEPETVENFYQIKRQPCEDQIERCARFIWLTNLSYGNVPPQYQGETGWKGAGTCLTTHPGPSWQGRILIIERLIENLVGAPCRVKSDGISLLRGLPDWATVFADPPYAGLARYRPDQEGDFIQPILTTPARQVLLSEAIDICSALPEGWVANDGEIVGGVSHHTGTAGKRKEWLYASPALVSGSAVTSHQ